MIDELLSRLDKVKSAGSDRYSARCPAHEDRSPSLSLCELQDGRVLIHCFAGCSPVEILNSVGLSMGDLFPEGCLGQFRGFEQLKQDIEIRRIAKATDVIELDQNVLKIANNMRKKGMALTREDLDREKLAFINVRKYENNNG